MYVVIQFDTNVIQYSQIANMFEDYPELLTITEAAELLRVSKITLKRWEKQGKITPIRINSRGDRRYTKQQIKALLGLEVGTEPIDKSPLNF